MGNRLEELTRRPEGVFAYGVYDAASAIVAERYAGHEVIYVGGYSAAGSKGLPDMGILTMTEIRDHVKFIAEAVNVPCIADIDDGFGDILDVERTVREFLEIRNVEAIHWEDQFGHRCGHISGKRILPFDESLGKFRVVVKTRNKFAPNSSLIARCDAFSAAGGNKDVLLGGDIEEVVRRLKAYYDLGADYLWCEFPNADHRSAKAVSEGVRKTRPNAVFAFNRSPSFSEKDWNESILTEEYLNELGYKLRFATYPALQAAAKAVHDSAVEFKRDPHQAMRSLKRQVAGTPAESIMRLVNVDKYLADEREYDPQGLKSQSDSEGFGTVKN